MDTARQQLTIGLIGVLLGGTLGAILGVAVGSTSDSSAPQPLIETVVRTQNVTNTDVLSAPTTTTPPSTSVDTNTGPIDTVPPITAPPPVPGTTVPGLTTPTTSTSTTTGPAPSVDSNSVAPADPASPPADFCDTHVCGPSYAEGDGPVVECADGVWTRQGGSAVTCSADGGLGKASGGA